MVGKFKRKRERRLWNKELDIKKREIIGKFWKEKERTIREKKEKEKQKEKK